MTSQSAYQQLNPNDRRHVDAIQAAFERALADDPGVKPTELLRSVDQRLADAALEQLLASFIDEWSERHRFPPTLSQLKSELVEVSERVTAVYPMLHFEQRLPEMLGTIVLLKVVARGGQGWTAEGLDREANQLRAVKFVDRIREPALADRLRHEAWILRQLQSSLVVDYRDYGETERYTYLATELISGCNLHDEARTRRFTESEILTLGQQLCDAVSFIHLRGISHNDIKPMNIFLRESGHPVLLDFGTAIPFQVAMLPVQKRPHFDGTTDFKAPEQLSGDASVDVRVSDVFSLAGTLGWLMTNITPNGQDPHQHAGFVEALTASDYSPPTIQAILAATQHSHVDRTPSAARLHTDLKRASSRLNIKARLLSIGKRCAIAAVCILAVLGLFNLQADPLEEKLDDIAQRQQAIAESDPMKSWVEKVADHYDFDINSVGSQDFRPSLTFMPAAETDMPLGAATLQIEVAPRLIDLSNSLQFRFSGERWRELRGYDGLPTAIPFQRLTSDDIKAGGQLEIRISEITNRHGAWIFGPFTYELDLAAEYRKAVKSQTEAVYEDLCTTEWMVLDNSYNYVWLLADDFEVSKFGLLDRIMIGADPDHLDVNVTIQPLTENDVKPLTNQKRWGRHSINEQLVTLRRHESLQRDIFASAVLHNGQVTPVRRFLLPYHLRTDPPPPDIRRTLEHNLLEPRLWSDSDPRRWQLNEKAFAWRSHYLKAVTLISDEGANVVIRLPEASALNPRHLSLYRSRLRHYLLAELAGTGSSGAEIRDLLSRSEVSLRLTYNDDTESDVITLKQSVP